MNGSKRERDRGRKERKGIERKKGMNRMAHATTLNLC